MFFSLFFLINRESLVGKARFSINATRDSLTKIIRLEKFKRETSLNRWRWKEEKKNKTFVEIVET